MFASGSGSGLHRGIVGRPSGYVKRAGLPARDPRPTALAGRGPPADAVVLWFEYKENGSRWALKTLLRYNAEDVKNTAPIRRKLDAR